MAISFISQASAAAATVAMPTHQTGDTILVYAWNNTSVTTPTTVAGFSNLTLTAATGSSCSARLAYKIAASSSETTGTWTSATHIIVMVYRGAIPLSLGTPNFQQNSNTTASTAVSYFSDPISTNDSSWVVRFAGQRTATDVNPSAIATGYTLRSSVGQIIGTDSNGPLVGPTAAADNKTVNTSSFYGTAQVELTDNPWLAGFSTVNFDAVGTTTTGNFASGTSTITWSHTATGTDRLAVVGIMVKATANGGAYTAFTRTVTYGGTPMYPLGSVAAGGLTTATSSWIEFYALFDPPTGAQTVSVTVSKASVTGSIGGNSTSYTNVGGVGTLKSASSSTGTSFTATIQGFPNGRVVASALSAQTTGSLTASNFTQRGSGITNPAWLMGDAAFTSLSSAQTAAGSGVTSGQAWGELVFSLIPTSTFTNTATVLFDSTGRPKSPTMYGTVGGVSVASPATWVHNSSGTDRAVLVAGTVSGATIAATTVDYAGNTMTLLASLGSVGLWGLLNPPTGDQTVTATASGATNMQFSSLSYQGVSSFGTAVTASTTAGITSTPPSGGAVVGVYDNLSSPSAVGLNVQASRLARINITANHMAFFEQRDAGKAVFTTSGLNALAVPLNPVAAATNTGAFFVMF